VLTVIIALLIGFWWPERALALAIGLPVQLRRGFQERAGRDYDVVRRVALGDWICVNEEAYIAAAEMGAIPVHIGFTMGRLVQGIPADERQERENPGDCAHGRATTRSLT
jgi:hypothetical protein